MENLIRGNSYKIVPDPCGLPHEKIYVMSQFLPKTEKIWRTFFSIVGMDDDWMIYRTKFPKDEIIGIEKKIIMLSEHPETTLVWPDEPDRKPLVRRWLNAVQQLIPEKYLGTYSFKEYFG
jgi:hypothetical protein